MKRMQKQTRAMGKRTMASKLYVKRNWQLYVFFLMPALGVNHHIQVSSDGWDC